MTDELTETDPEDDAIEAAIAVFKKITARRVPTNGTQAADQEVDFDPLVAEDLSALSGIWAGTSPDWTPLPDFYVGAEGAAVFSEGCMGPIFEIVDPYPRGANNPTENLVFACLAHVMVPRLLRELFLTRKLTEAATTYAIAFRLFARDTSDTDACANLKAAGRIVKKAMKDYHIEHCLRTGVNPATGKADTDDGR